MEIKLTRARYALTEPIPLSVTITNRTAAPLLRDDPERSMEVSIHLRDQATREDLSYSMGRVTTTVIDRASGQHATVLPPRTEVPLSPGASLTFTTDLGERLYLRPGHYRCQVQDHEVLSNQLDLTIEVTEKAVDALVSLARDPAAGYGRREWAAGWLQRLYPGFRIHLTLPDAPAQARARDETHNAPIYEAFAAWWKAQRGRPGTQELLRRL